jgi:hypothetical protein
MNARVKDGLFGLGILMAAGLAAELSDETKNLTSVFFAFIGILAFVAGTGKCWIGLFGPMRTY